MSVSPALAQFATTADRYQVSNLATGAVTAYPVGPDEAVVATLLTSQAHAASHAAIRQALIDQFVEPVAITLPGVVVSIVPGEIYTLPTSLFDAPARLLVTGTMAQPQPLAPSGGQTIIEGRIRWGA